MEVGRCFVCGRFGIVEKHHIFNGSGFRKKSDADGLIVTVCRVCHDEIHRNRSLRDEIKKCGQLVYQKKHGAEGYLKRYRRNYLDGDETLEEVKERIKRYGREKDVKQSNH